ncbi:hypothetical protein M3O96_00100 [Aquiflexum sp. TKW24L]|uniref:hypothetical protein n=1 Tax=Aquiflexum sp. TKW24L TaxID=2942212 RepID=UPI0020C07F6C|nr:hypothetical protein [Aquiflexum sp. TKW24L]MCL6257470.1 hypothetical protein [Aquiflexum sp. TKW24L]
MKGYCLVFVSVYFLIQFSYAQSPCPYFDQLMSDAQKEWKNDFENALNKLAAAREHCPKRANEVDQLIIKITQEIKENTKKVETSYRNLEKQKEEINRSNTENKRLLEVSEENAFKLYGNEFSFYSESEFRKGKIASAYYSSYFAYRYLDPKNPKIVKSLLNANFFSRSDQGDRYENSSTLFGHFDEVIKVFRQENGNIISVSADGEILTWYKNRQNPKKAPSFDPYSIFAFSPNGSKIAKVTNDSTIMIQNLEKSDIPPQNLKIEKNQGQLSNLTFSHSGDTLYYGTSIGFFGYFNLNNNLSSLILNNAILEPFKYNSIKVSKNNKWIAIFSIYGEEILILNTKTLDLKSKYTNTKDPVSTEKSKTRNLPKGSQYPSLITCLEFSASGDSLVFGDSDGWVNFLNIDENKTNSFKVHQTSVTTLNVSNNNTYVSSSFDPEIKIWDLKSIVQDSVIQEIKVDYFINDIYFTTIEDPMIVGNVDNTVVIWDHDHLEPPSQIFPKEKNAIFTGLSNSGDSLISITNDGRLVFRDIISSEIIDEKFLLEGISKCGISSNNKLIACETVNDDLFLINQEFGKKIKIEGIFGERLDKLVFSPNDSILAIGSNNHIFLVSTWDTGKLDTIKVNDLEFKFSLNDRFIAILGDSMSIFKLDSLSKPISIKSPQVFNDSLSSLYFKRDILFLSDPIKNTFLSYLGNKIELWELTKDMNLKKRIQKRLPGSKSIALLTASLNDKIFSFADEYGQINLFAIDGNSFTFLHSFDVDWDAYFNEDYVLNLTLSKNNAVLLSETENSVNVRSLLKPLSISNQFDTNVIQFQVLKELGLGKLFEQSQKFEYKVLNEFSEIQLLEVVKLLKEEGKESGDMEFSIGRFRKAEKILKIQEKKSENKDLINEALGDLYFISTNKILEDFEPDSAFYFLSQANRYPSDEFNLHLVWADYFERSNDQFDLNKLKDEFYIRGFALFLSGKSPDIDMESISGNILTSEKIISLYEQYVDLENDPLVIKELSNYYNNLGYYKIFVGDGISSEAALYKALKYDSTNLYPYTNIPPALLLQGRIEEAKFKYMELKDNYFDDYLTFKEVFLEDLNLFETMGIKGIDFNLVRIWLGLFTQVEYSYGGNETGTFEQTGPFEWQETNSDGVFLFEEITRDGWNIYLNAPGKSIQLDLFKNQILYNDAFLYNIIESSILQGSLVDALKNDGLIKSKNDSIKVINGIIYINGKEQSEEVSRKYSMYF